MRMPLLSVLLLLLALATSLAGCSDDFQCQTSDECLQGELCRAGRCVLLQQSIDSQSEGTSSSQTYSPATTYTPQTTTTPQTTKTSTSASTTTLMDLGTPHQPATQDMAATDASVLVPDQTSVVESKCPGIAPRPGDLTINEVLVNVPVAERGDANRDGKRDAYADEFVELVNVSKEHLDLRGIQIANDTRPKMTFPSLCLPPGEAVVVFGGPKMTPSTYDPQLKLHTMVAQSRFGFNNESGLVRLRTSEGQDLFLFAYDEAPFASYQLWPELVGGAFISHEEVVPEAPALFSPGLCSNFAPLHTGCVHAN